VRYSTDTDGDISPQDITLDTRTNCWNYRGVFSTNTYMTSVYRKKLRIRRPLPGNVVDILYSKDKDKADLYRTLWRTPGKLTGNFEEDSVMYRYRHNTPLQDIIKVFRTTKKIYRGKYTYVEELTS
jgi:hypothetical protein